MSWIQAGVLAAATETAPAGGAGLDEVGLVGGIGGLVAAGSVFVAARLRAGGLTPLRRSAEALGDRAGMQAWAALPLLVMLAAVVSAFYGMTADISWHMNEGRDASALGNPTHYPILIGLYVWWFGACLSAGLTKPGVQSGRGAVNVAPSWSVPAGTVLALVGLSVALTSFPLDDIWHRLFGQDVTFWGPTHLLLVGGGTVAFIGMTLNAFAGLVDTAPRAVVVGLRVFVAAAIAVLPSLYLMEWNLGTIQAHLLHDPVVAALGSAGLVVGRLWLGRGGAIVAAVAAVTAAMVFAFVTGPVLSQTAPRFHLLLPAALAVEAAALIVGTRAIGRFLVLAGVLAGTLGTLGEWAWTNAVRPVPWPASIMPEALAFATITAVAGACLGALLLGGLSAGSRGILPSRATAGLGGAALAAVVGVLVVLSLPGPPSDVRATITVTETTPGAERAGTVRVTFDPPQAAEGADWRQVLAWQGGGLIVQDLRRVDGNAWETTSAVPLHGSWKTMIRLAKDGRRGGVFLYAPADAAIPAPAITPPSGTVTVPVGSDERMLQRERRADTPVWLWGVGLTVVYAIWAFLLLMVAWALGRAAGGRSGGGQANRRLPDSAYGQHPRPFWSLAPRT